jgi:hypothetical protein
MGVKRMYIYVMKNNINCTVGTALQKWGKEITEASEYLTGNFFNL